MYPNSTSVYNIVRITYTSSLVLKIVNIFDKFESLINFQFIIPRSSLVTTTFYSNTASQYKAELKSSVGNSPIL